MLTVERNNKSGFKGVHWNSNCCKWHAQIRIKGKQTYLGLFMTAEEAHAAYVAVAKEHFGEFARVA